MQSVVRTNIIKQSVVRTNIINSFKRFEVIQKPCVASYTFLLQIHVLLSFPGAATGRLEAPVNE